MRSSHDIHTTACGVVPYDHVYNTDHVGAGKATRGCYAPYERINRLRNFYFYDAPQYLDSFRVKIWTEVYKENESQPPVVKKARAMAKYLENCELSYNEGELLLTDDGTDVYHSFLYPEYTNWFYGDMHRAPMYTREYNPHLYTETTEEDVFGAEEYWKGKSVKEKILARMPEEVAKGCPEGGGVTIYNPQIMIETGIGHITANFGYALEKGLGGMKADVRAALEKVGKPTTMDGLKALQFHEAQLTVLEAWSTYFRRYAAFAKEKANEFSSQQTKDELLKMGEICGKLAEDAPTDFWEALMLVNSIYRLEYLENGGFAISWGRMDQYLYPYYKYSLDNGIYTKDFMQELLDFMFLFASTAGGVMADIPGIDFYRGGTKGYSSGTAVIIGGVDKDGNDATNDLSFMLLDAMAQTRMCSPWPTVRWHDGTPYELKIKTVEVMRCGTGHPKILNDNVCIEAFRRYGVPLEEARDYVLDPTKTRVKGAKLILVPTTAGTGSDVTNALIIAVSSKGAKIGIGGKELYSDISLLDPLLTLSLPRKQTASTAMDAFSHCVESMLSAISNPICDILSLEGIRLVVNNIEKVMENGNDVETRQNIMLAAYLGGMSLNDGACNFGHALAHTLGAEYRIPHGELCAVALPMVIEYFAEIFPEKIRKIAKAMGLEPPASASNAEIAAITADAVRALRARLGLSKFSDFAFGYEDLPRLSEMIMGDTCIGALRISVPNHEVTPEDFLIPMQKEYNRE